uniref:Uncharacterized protein n=1 Tax=Candidatus Kentrum sp. TC TaxID=2126339 RepID=A0A450Z5L0_9GAMM|nr:MAG: hypothetical protein BECKTC1821D_GA0114238_106412 [Candidatus Kentron sp. TC]
MYGFWVVRDHAWWGLLGAFVFGVFMWHFRPSSMPWLRWIGLPLLALAFLFIYRLGEISAERVFEQNHDLGFRDYPLTRVWLTPATEADPGLKLARLMTGLEGGKYRLLIHSRTSLFLIEPGDGNLPMVQIPLRRVAAIRRISVNPGRR